MLTYDLHLPPSSSSIRCDCGGENRSLLQTCSTAPVLRVLWDDGSYHCLLRHSGSVVQEGDLHLRGQLRSERQVAANEERLLELVQEDALRCTRELAEQLYCGHTPCVALGRHTVMKHEYRMNLAAATYWCARVRA